LPPYRLMTYGFLGFACSSWSFALTKILACNTRFPVLPGTLFILQERAGYVKQGQNIWINAGAAADFTAKYL